MDLGRDHVALACDQRGHGASTTADPRTSTLQQMAADVGHMIGGLGLEPAVLIGHSYGTRVALLAAEMHPSLVRAVVLVDGSRVWNQADWSEVASSLAEFDAESYFQKITDELLLDRLPTATQDRIRHSMKFTPAEVLSAITRSTAPWDAFAMPKAVRTLEAPLLAIQSTYHDNDTPRYSLAAGQSSRYIDLLRAPSKPDTEIVVLDGVGHFSMLEATEQVNQGIRDFVSRLAPRHN